MDLKKDILVTSFIRLVALAVISPFYFFPKMEHLWVMVVGLILWIGSTFLSRDFFDRIPLNMSISILILLVTSSIFINGNFERSLPKFSGVILALMLFYSIADFLRELKNIKFFLKGVAAFSVIFALVGWMGMFTFRVKHFDLLEKLKDTIPKVDFGFTGMVNGFHPNAVAGVLILVFPLFIALTIFGFRKKAKWIWKTYFLIASSITGIVILLSQSRGAWGGIFLSFGLLLLTGIKSKKLITVVLVSPLIILSLMPLLFNLAELPGGFEQAQVTLKFRFNLWMTTIPVIGENPFLGIGMNSFRFLPDVKNELSHPHNGILNVIVESGIGAGIAYIGLLIVLGGMCWYVWKNSEPEPLYRFSSLGLGAGQLAYFFYGFTDSIPLGSKLGVFFWLSCALITGLYRIVSKDERDTCN